MRAFSLVELSIVLVILGLLTGGILAGQSLIRAAELRSVVSDIQRYSTAVMTFRDRYMALPGDMSNATRFWGALDGNDGLGSDCYDAYSTSTATCNGNGNGAVWFNDGQAENAPEGFHAWKHMANAGLIEGSYTGRRGAELRQGIPGVNIPASRIRNAGYMFESIEIGAGHVEWYEGVYNPIFFFGSVRPALGPADPVLTAVEAWNIDTKLDDGRPASGRVLTSHNIANCVTPTGNANRNTAQYAVAASGIACAFMFSGISQ